MSNQEHQKGLSLPVEDASFPHQSSEQDDNSTAQYLVRTPSFSDNNTFNVASDVNSPWLIQYGNDEMQQFNRNGFSVVKEKCESALVKMRQNFVRFMDRGNQIESLLECSDSLNQTTSQYNDQARALENQIWWRRWLVPILLILVITVLMTILCFLNRFVFWFLVACIILGLFSMIYFYVQKRYRQLNPLVPSEVAMSII